MQKLSLLITVLIFPFFLFAQKGPLSIGDSDGLFSIANRTKFKADQSWKMTFADALKDTTFAPMEQNMYKLGGLNPHNIWIQFQLDVETHKEIYLELSTAITDSVYLYSVSPSGKVTTQQLGKLIPFYEKKIKNNYQVFPLTTQKGEQTSYYLNMRSRFPLSVQIRVGSHEHFEEEWHQKSLLHGAFVGIICIVALFNLFFYFSTGEHFYGFYVGYAVFIMAVVLRFDGYLFQFLHPRYPNLNNIGYYFHGLAGIFGIYFSRSFLKTQKYTPHLDKGLIFFLWIYAANICMAILGLYELNILSVYIITFPFNLFLLYTGICVYNNGYQIARFFAGAAFCLTLGITVFTLQNMGFIVSNIWTQNSMYIGIAIESVLFFMAIVDRFSILKQENHDVQQLMIDSLRENELLIRKQNRILEDRVLSRTQELEQAKLQLSEYAKKLIQSNEELTDFAHIASHDLRAPIRNIGSFTQLLEKKLSKQLDERSLEYLGFIKTNVRQSTKLIEDLLNYSKIDKNIGDALPVDLNHVLVLASNNLQSFISEKHAHIVSEELPILKGHSSLFIQLFQNLINNGLKYNKSEVPVINISTEWQGNDIVFKVRDNGIGILPEYQKQVFGMFRRLHSAAEYEGSGIGLAFCQRIVSTYGGSIWLESEEGVGTTFFFTLPKAVSRKISTSTTDPVPTPQLVNKENLNNFPELIGKTKSTVPNPQPENENLLVLS